MKPSGIRDVARKTRELPGTWLLAVVLAVLGIRNRCCGQSRRPLLSGPVLASSTLSLASSRSCRSHRNRCQCGRACVSALLGEDVWLRTRLSLPSRGLPHGNDKPEHVLGTHEPIARNEMVCRAVKKVHEQIGESAYPNIPLMWTEFNADYGNHTEITDSAFMGPFLADTIRQCDGLAEAMSYWTFSDVFEEQGVVKAPFYGGFGLIAERGTPKPAFHAFALLHRLDHTRLDAASESFLVTRRQDGSLVIAVWNLFLPEETGAAKTVTLHFRGVPQGTSARITMVDKEHGPPLPAYNKMGRPRFPTAAQIAELRKAVALPASRSRRIEKDSLTLTLEPQALALIEMGKPGL